MTYVIAATGKKLEDPCPQCWNDELTAYAGSKLRCQSCGFILPCCDGAPLARQEKRCTKNHETVAWAHEL